MTTRARLGRVAILTVAGIGAVGAAYASGHGQGWWSPGSEVTTFYACESHGQISNIRTDRPPSCGHNARNIFWRQGVGEPGPTGPEGPAGPTGAQGIQGEHGAQGDRGLQGERGALGERGLQGERGVPGEQGVQGLTGERGAQGEQGIQGERGAQGAPGLPGKKGDPGVPGAPGPSGSAGPFHEIAELLDPSNPEPELPFSSMRVVGCSAPHRLELSAGGAVLGSVRGFVAHEEISAPFRYEIAVAASSGALDGLLGAAAALSYDRNGRTTTFEGVVTKLTLAAVEPGGVFVYALELGPALSRLALSETLRTFRGQSAPDVVRRVLGDADVPSTFQLNGQHEEREFVLEYGETDFAFVSRLMEEEGIHYHFVAGPGGHNMVIADDNSRFETLPDLGYYGHTSEPASPSEEHLVTLSSARTRVTDTVELRGYDFKKPTTPISSTQGSGTAVVTRFEHRLVAKVLADQAARVELERAKVASQRLDGTSTSADLRAGGKFNVVQSGGGFSGQYLVTSVRHLGKVEGDGCIRFGNQFSAIPASVPFRAAPRHPKPVLSGVTTAFVDGPPGEAMDTDAMGRVKVRFPWAGDASDWVRFSLPLASKERGFMFLPEAGDEVVVAFEGGDPDRPVVVGSVRNPVLTPPPRALPANKRDMLFLATLDTVVSLVDAPGHEAIRLSTKGPTSLVLDGSTGNESASLTVKSGTSLVLNGGTGKESASLTAKPDTSLLLDGSGQIASLMAAADTNLVLYGQDGSQAASFAVGDTAGLTFDASADGSATFFGGGGLLLLDRDAGRPRFVSTAALEIAEFWDTTTGHQLGGRYADNAVVAWARVASDGTIVDGQQFGIGSVTRVVPGVYRVTLGGYAGSAESLVPIVTPEVSGNIASPLQARFVMVAGAGPSAFFVQSFNPQLGLADTGFTFLVTGR